MTLTETAESFTVTDIALDVSDAVPVDQPCSIGATLFIPRKLADRPVVVVAVPGGTYSRRYFDLAPPGRSGYSQARYFAERGVVFAACDYLGGGDSTRPEDGDRLTLPVLADAAHAALARLREALAAGGFGVVIDDPLFVGLGFSFGGGVEVIHAGKYPADYDGLMIWGYSPIAADNHDGHEIPDNWDELSEDERRAIVRANNTAIVGGELPVYHGAPRFGAWRSHYLPDTDEELIRYDDEQVQTLVPRMAGIDVMTSGFTLPYARQVTCPVLMAFADGDIVRNPHEQTAAYSSSELVTLTVIPDSRHLVNFLPTRQLLWDRSLAWLRSLPGNGRAER
jgi:alpha-beta hydrolase superfamily lysophospholipase